MSQSRLKRENRIRLLRSIAMNGPMPRSMIAKQLSLTQAAVSRLVREFIDAEVLEERGKIATSGRPGRQFIRVGFASGGHYLIGIGFEAFSQSVVIADLNRNVIDTRSLGLTEFSDIRTVTRKIARTIEMMLAENGIGSDRVIGVGLAIVGTVNRSEGRVIHSAPLAWDDVPIGEALEDATGLPTIVDNLLHSTNLAENAFGVSSDHDQILLVRTSLSVGTSLLLDHKVARGAKSQAGQIAHAPVRGSLDRCACGAVGCLETVASGRSIVNRIDKRKIPEPETGNIGLLSRRLADILQQAEQGHRGYRQTIFEAGQALGEALEWPVLTMDPDCIVLSGPVARHPSYVAGIKAGLSKHRIPFDTEPDRLLVSRMTIPDVASRLAFMEFVMTRDLAIERFQPDSLPADGSDFARSSAGVALG